MRDSLDIDPPILTLQGGPNLMHKFLGFLPDRHIIFMTARDPADVRDMPPNLKDSISAYCIRGVRKVSHHSSRRNFLHIDFQENG